MSNLYDISSKPLLFRKLLAEAPNIEADFAHFKTQYRDLTSCDHATKALILQCHLVVEYYMTKYLEAANPASPRIGLVGLNFKKKAELVDHPNANFHFLMPGVSGLNRLRNKIAHRLDYVPKESDFTPLLQGIKIWHKAAGKPIPKGVEIVRTFAELICSFFHGDTQGIIRHGDGCGLPGLIKWWKEENR